ncbi:hypothetical protein [Aquisalimonas asiatica]|uniref:Uncharacterized protein n=1 Tax=Aquisalimonas asiatica TaxID=406100 RepID=A0A1H8RSX7_9GAMM|nr:hypothetical protein [Aquisalimonas asiatica]SEO69462.1 hypothetical protein SAMN04488052_102228 [Aquisalimonas asiatica]
MLSNAEARQRGHQILSRLSSLSGAEMIQVLNTAMTEVIAGMEGRRGDPPLISPSLPESAAVLAERRPGRASTIRTNPEIRAFIHSLRGYRTYDEITAACRKRFGSRSPSRSAIHRYIMQLKYPNRRNQAHE